MDQKKVCMIGAFAVGKTSLVRRFVHGLFSEKYKSTIGVKIDRRVVETDGQDTVLLLWDLAGEDELMSIRTSYVRGSGGLILVVDGTRTETLPIAHSLAERLDAEFGVLPKVVVVNKKDLDEEWSLSADDIQRELGRIGPVILTSAKTGEGVSEVFETLTALMRASQP